MHGKTDVVPDRRIHIVGSVRSGTSLMHQLVSTCFEVGGACEHEMPIFDPPPPRQGVFVSKHPADVSVLHRLLDADPSLHVVVMDRDPRSVVTSIHPGWPHTYYADFRVWAGAHLAGRRLLPHPRVIRVRYETLLTEPDSVQERMRMRFPFLSPSHPFSQYQRFARVSEAANRAMNGLRALDPSRIDAWRGHLPRLRAQVLGHPTLVRVVRDRYDDDLEWVRALAEVAPRWSASHRTGRCSVIHRLERAVRLRRKVARYVRDRSSAA